MFMKFKLYFTKITRTGLHIKLQEVHYKNIETQIVKGGNAVYKLYWSDESTGQGGVGLINLVKKVIDVKHLNPRIIVMN